MTKSRRRRALLFCSALCAAVAGCSSMTPGPVAAVRATTAPDRPRVGSVYLLRGWIGVFSAGIDQLGTQFEQAGVHARVFQEAQWESVARAIAESYKSAGDAREPLVLVGHSFGADGVLKISRALAAEGVAVDLVVTLDPVAPPPVAPNVARVVNLFQSNGAWDRLPMFRGIPLEAPVGVELTNWDLKRDRRDLYSRGLNHWNIEKRPEVHDEVVRQVLAVCVPRGAWLEGQVLPGHLLAVK